MIMNFTTVSTTLYSWCELDKPKHSRAPNISLLLVLLLLLLVLVFVLVLLLVRFFFLRDTHSCRSHTTRASGEALFENI